MAAAAVLDLSEDRAAGAAVSEEGAILEEAALASQVVLGWAAAAAAELGEAAEVEVAEDPEAGEAVALGTVRYLLAAQVDMAAAAAGQLGLEDSAAAAAALIRL